MISKIKNFFQGGGEEKSEKCQQAVDLIQTVLSLAILGGFIFWIICGISSQA
jgi:hypothetical protein